MPDEGRAAAGMSPGDIPRLVQAGDPRVSPSGHTVAFTVTMPDVEANCYRSRIWVVPADGTGHPAPFTIGEGRQSLPRWSPDGGSLAFVSTADDQSSRLCVAPLTAGWEESVICVWPDVVTDLAWSPDGDALAFVARDPEPERYGTPEARPKAKDMPARRITKLFSRRDNEGWIADRPARIFVVAADGSSPPRCLTPGPFEASGLAWSPDGTRIAFASGRHDSWDLDRAQDLHVVEVAGGKLTCLTETAAAYGKPAWSPDGRRLAYLRNPTPLDGPRHVQVGVLDVESRRSRDLTVALDRNCSPNPPVRGPIWDRDDVLFLVEDGGNVHLYRAGAGGAPALEIGGDRCLDGWDKAGGTLVFVASDPTHLPELYAVHPDGEQRLTDFSTPFAAQLELVAPEPFTATAPDGTEVQCWAMPPAGRTPGRPVPVLLNIHGGPFTQYGNRFFDEFQVQAGAGFGVLYCNPRGSSGSTEARGRSIRWPECAADPGSGWGGVDYDDVLACVDEACRRFAWIDPERMGVMGGSYGGYLTSWIIGHTDRFAAACSERACNNLLTLEQHSDIATTFRTNVGASHLEDPAAYLRQSPITYVEQMTTPLLILHSEEDLRCPIDQAEELFVSLRLLGRTPEFVRFPGESHELSRSGAPGHRVARAEIILDWFTRRLDPRHTGRAASDAGRAADA